MQTFKKVQGNSLWVDIACDSVAIIDPVWANWSGTWSIVSTLGGPVILSGTLIRGATGVFLLRIGPSTGGVVWATLPAGTYFLLTEIINESVDYLFEDQDKLIIAVQGM